jgi:catechol-2,3-dioxygenase
MVKVTKLGFIGMNAVNMEQMQDYYRRVVGLPELHADSKLALYTCGPDRHAVSLHASATPGIRHVGLEVAPGQSMAEMKNALQAIGISSEIRTDELEGVAECLRFADPDGAILYLYYGAGVADQPYGLQGIGPQKLGHLAFFVESAKRSEAFYSQAMGFRWADWVEDVFLFMRCNKDHHTMNFLQSSKRGMFHVAFELKDFSHIGRCSDILSQNRMPLIWGPGRHGAGHNIFLYHYDPDGNVIEYFTELDQMFDEDLGYYDPRPYHKDRPQRPKVWPLVPESGNMWGPRPPAGFGAMNNAQKPA